MIMIAPQLIYFSYQHPHKLCQIYNTGANFSKKSRNLVKSLIN